MKRFLLALLIGMGVSTMGWAASEGDSCQALLTGSKYKVGSWQCRYLCDTIVTGDTFDCGPVAVPFSRVKSMEVSIRSTTTNCTFDAGDVVGLLTSADDFAGHLVVYGTLDDDTPAAAPGNTVAVIVPDGVLLRPYVGIDDILTAGTCAGTDGLDVIAIFQEDLER